MAGLVRSAVEWPLGDRHPQQEHTVLGPASPTYEVLEAILIEYSDLQRGSYL